MDNYDGRFNGRRLRNVGVPAPGEVRAPEAEDQPDFYSIPEWQRTASGAAMLGHKPQEASMDEQGAQNPEGWNSLPDWMRTDMLRQRGFGSGMGIEPDPKDAARQKMLIEQMKTETPTPAQSYSGGQF
jgi:hypothetical protein